MSFGFAIGDFIAVGRLTVDIVNSLRASKSDYQELIRELERYAAALMIDEIYTSTHSRRPMADD